MYRYAYAGENNQKGIIAENYLCQLVCDMATLSNTSLTDSL